MKPSVCTACEGRIFDRGAESDVWRCASCFTLFRVTLVTSVAAVLDDNGVTLYTLAPSDELISFPKVEGVRLCR